jgi:hypothetical protein
MTNSQPAARRSQKPSSHQSIEAADPMMSRITGSAAWPKACTHSSTSLARTIRSADSPGGPAVRDGDRIIGLPA